jgi:transposase
MAVAIEIASAKWVVGSFAGGKVRRKVLSAEGPGERLEALLAEIVEALVKFDLSAETRVVVGYEAGQEGFWLLRALVARGIEAVVVDPVSVQVDRRAKRAKTDRLDADALAVGLWRYARSEPGALRVVRVPGEEAEDSREWQRERDRLSAERRGLTDRIGKKLRTHGIWVLAGDWRAALREDRLRGFSGRPLGPQLRAALVIELERLELVECKLKEMRAQAATLDQTTCERIEKLQRLRGIGATGARALAMLLFWRMFKNRREVGACIGAVGTPYESGTMQRDQGISKVGDARLRALLVELSWLWLRLQPDSAITRWFAQRTQGAGARGRRVMIVAVARRLAIALWRYVTQGEVPAGATLKTLPA